MVKTEKDTLQDRIRTVTKVAYTVSLLSNSIEGMTKKNFVETIKLLVEINDRSAFMVDELGIDIYDYDDKYQQVIYNLLSCIFTTNQVETINTYLLSQPSNGEVENIDITVGNVKRNFKFSSEEDLWEIIQQLEKK